MKIKIQEAPLSLSWIAEAVNGRLQGTDAYSVPAVRYICTDSREADAETLFCAIVGERVDGHNYIAAAMKLGCRAVLCEKEPAEDICAVLVPHTVEAMGHLAEAYRGRYLPELLTVAITGSVGKTTTKECTAAVLSTDETLFKKDGNYNSTIGLPLSVMEIGQDHTAAVLEMGMSGFGEIAAMSQTVHPDIACIINIGTSHMEHLGSREGIARAKTEMIQGMKQGSTLLINGDEPLLADVKERCREREISCLRVSFGDATAEFYAEGVTATQDGMHFDLHTPKGILKGLFVPAVGDHMVWAASFAAAVGVLRGLSHEDIRKGLTAYHPAGMRQNISRVSGITVIEDCYNAAPESMAAALSALKMTAQGRMIAVLGDMKELGQHTVALHRGVGRKVAELAAEGRDVYLVTVGALGAEIAAGAAEGLPTDRIFVTTDPAPYEAAVRLLRTLLCEGDTVLYKASRSMTLEVVPQALKSND